jgi:NAD(P)-dependent dehydrogenase (short-subunit alcohol dehydrogenase family)
MHGKLCLVTGANSGIGRATAMALARQGAGVLMVCRDHERGESARAEIARAARESDVQLLIADLASQQSIRELSATIHDRFARLDVLVNNAGAFMQKRATTVDGLETTFAVNHLAYFLLTDLLLDLLRAPAPARIVNVSSGAHLRAHIDFNDLQNERGYNGWRAYGRSKLANVLFTYALARRLEDSGITVNAVHPGVVATNFGRSSGFVRFGMRAVSRFFLSPEEGADTVVYLATSPEVEGVTGTYFVKRKPARTSPEARDREIQERLWRVSAALTGLPPEGQAG